MDRSRRRNRDARTAIGFETRPRAAARAEAQEHVWNEIWKRRILYFATVGATLWLVVFPLVSSAQRADEYYSRLRWVSDLVRFIGGFLPGFASTWINGYARAPFWFVVMVVLLSVLMYMSTRVAARTSNLMSSIWRQTPSAPTSTSRQLDLPAAQQQGLYRLS